MRTARWMVGVMLAGVALPAWAQSDALREAVRLHRPEALAQARSELQACRARTPACPEAGSLVLLLGTLLLSEGEPAEAGTVLEGTPPPPLLEAYHAYALGQARFYTRAYGPAAELFQRAQETGPRALAERAEARRGEALLAAGRAQEALAVLEAALRRDASAELLFQRARAYLAEGQQTKARDDLRAVVVRYPAHPLAQDALALQGTLSGKARWRMRFEERMTRARGLLGAGHAPFALEELEAITREKLARKAAERAEHALLLGRTLSALDRDKEAATQLARAKKGPMEVAADAAMFEARRTLRTDDHSAARTLLSAVAERYPKSNEADEAAFLTGWLYVQDGLYEEAVTTFTELEKRFPRSRRRDEARWYAALARLQQGRHAEARALLERLVSDFPRSGLVPQARYWKARAMQLSDGAADYFGEYTALIEAYPASWYALMARARLEEAGQPVPSGFAAPPCGRQVEPPGSLALARALAQAGLFPEAAEEVAAQVGAVRKAEDALNLGHALAAMELHGAAYTLANRHLWGEAFGRKNPEALALFYPRAWASSVESEAARAEVEPWLVWAIMRRESAFRPEAHSHANARGLMQLIPPTAKAIARELGQPAPAPGELFSPGLNVRYASWYLARLLERFKHPALAAAAYNGGPSAVLKWVKERRAKPLDLFVEEIPYKETRGYVKQVLADLYLYRSFYGEAPGSLALSLEVPAPASKGVTF